MTFHLAKNTQSCVKIHYVGNRILFIFGSLQIRLCTLYADIVIYIAPVLFLIFL